MVNPLDLPGPEFLKLYSAYGLGVFLLAWLLRVLWLRTASVPAGARFSPGMYPAAGDAYILALLRGGTKEVALAVLGRLVAEKFLVLKGSLLRQPEGSPADGSRLSPLEEEALAVFASRSGGFLGFVPSANFSSVMKKIEPRLAGARAELAIAGLAPGDRERKVCRAIGLATLVLISGPGAAKLLVAIERGRSNIQFLIVLLIVSILASLALMKPPLQTAAGKRYLSWLQESHQELRNRVSAGRREGIGELALVAGIFGLDVLPSLAPLQKMLVPSAGDSSGGGDSGGCGGGGGCGGCGA